MARYESKVPAQGLLKFKVAFKAVGKKSERQKIVFAPTWEAAKKEVEQLPDCVRVSNVYQCMMELQYLPQEVAADK